MQYQTPVDLTKHGFIGKGHSTTLLLQLQQSTQLGQELMMMQPLVLPWYSYLKLEMLINFLSPTLFEYISDCTDFDTAMQNLETLFVKPKNEIVARHLLTTRKQQMGKTLDEYLNAVNILSKDCQTKAATAEVYRQELIQDSFINGIQLQHIRQRLLENVTLTLAEATTQARALEIAQKTSDSYNNPKDILPLNSINKEDTINLKDDTLIITSVISVEE